MKLSVVLLLLGWVTWARAASPFSDQLLLDEPFWSDGKAEVAVFNGTEKRYGIARETEVRHILVRESFAAQEQVKAGNWRAPGTYPVIKLNQIIAVPTGSYRYDQSHSAFWRADAGTLIKFAHTTNDSCGLTYKQGNFTGTRWRYRAFTYWEGLTETDTRAAPPAGAVFYDELPFKLRLIDWGKTTRFTAPLMASVIGSKPETLVWNEAVFSVERQGEAWRVKVVHAKGEDRFYFDATSPYGLRRWERADGTALTRTQVIRIPYWKLNAPGDERYLLPGATYP